MVALSCNDVESHKGWIADIKSFTPGSAVRYRILADLMRELAVKFGMLDAEVVNAQGILLAARPMYIFGGDKTLKLSMWYLATSCHNFHQVLRVVDSLQLTASLSMATLANWNLGDKCMIVPGLSYNATKQRFPKGFKTVELPSGKSYIRLTPQPNID